MGEWQWRGRGTRLVVTLAALASLILGYYAGQYWQRRPLSGLSAIVYPSGQRIHTIDELTALAGADQAWRLFLVIDTQSPSCSALLRHFAHVFNRLAAWPDIQANLRLSLLAMDQPNEGAIAAFTAGASWVEVVSADPQQLAQLSEELGITPGGADWCGENQRTGALVSPTRRRWALLPYEPAPGMARNLQRIIAFVD
mgnify:FL=1